MKRSSSSIAAGVSEAYDDLVDACDAYLNRFPFLVNLSRRAGIRPVYIPVIGAVILSMVFGVLDNLISNAVGFFYPAWQSFKAIESPDKQDDRQWLTYWVVYAFFTFVEIFGDFLLFWVPCYHLIKVAFLLWLFLPQFKGASVIYAQIIRPLLLQYEGHIDATLNRVVGSAAVEQTTEVTSLDNKKRTLIKPRNVFEVSPNRIE